MALATTYAAGSKKTNNAQKAYEDYVQEKAHTVSGKPVTEAAQQALGPATTGQTYSSNYYDGNVTTKKYNADGTIAGTDVRPYEQTINKQSDGTIVTQQSPLSVTYKAPTKRLTTVTKNNGEVYTFEGDNWVKYANDNGIDVGGVSTAITYPDYVDAKEANRYINEMGGIYGVTPGAPVGNGDVYTKRQGLSKIPDYDMPYASAATGQTPTSQAYFEGLGVNVNAPAGTTGNVNLDYLNNVTGGVKPGGYQPFDWTAYITEAVNSYNDSIEAQRQASDAKFADAMNKINNNYDQSAQEAYVVNYIANKALQDSLKESGIKGGASETSLMRGQANFENAYNENERARINALAEIELQSALTEAGYTSQQAEMMANMILQGAQFAQAENAAMNDYNWNAYIAGQNQANADREFNLQMQQYEDGREMEMAQLAYELGDLKKLQEMGYDTTLAQAEIEAQMRKLAGTGANPTPKPTPTPIASPIIYTSNTTAGYNAAADAIDKMYTNNATPEAMAYELVNRVATGEITQDESTKIAKAYGLNI